MELLKVGAKEGMEWTDLETRLAASLVYRWLKAQRDDPAVRTNVHVDEIARACQLDNETVRHAMLWMRGKGVDLRVQYGERLFEGGFSPSTIYLGPDTGREGQDQ